VLYVVFISGLKASKSYLPINKRLLHNPVNALGFRHLYNINEASKSQEASLMFFLLLMLTLVPPAVSPKSEVRFEQEISFFSPSGQCFKYED